MLEHLNLDSTRIYYLPNRLDFIKMWSVNFLFQNHMEFLEKHNLLGPIQM